MEQGMLEKNGAARSITPGNEVDWASISAWVSSVCTGCIMQKPHDLCAVDLTSTQTAVVVRVCERSYSYHGFKVKNWVKVKVTCMNIGILKLFQKSQ